MIGKTISHYKILEKLGEGGMGEVYLAEDLKLERKVAIKFLPQHLTKNKENVERFEREAKAAAALNHPNIVTIYEIAEVDNQTFIVMEYIDGQWLRTKIENGISDLDGILDIINQICDGLFHAHKADIVHRDIKPENILIDKNGRVKILDFGLAKLKGVSKLTKETSALGTIHYMSPEQIQGQEVDHRSDIWSLGVVLYEMLTGKVPFAGDYEQAVIYSILNEEPAPITNLQLNISSRLQSAVSKCLEKNLNARYRNVSALRLELHNDHQNLSVSTSSNKRSKILGVSDRFVRHWPWIAGVLIIVALTLITTLKLFIPTDAEQNFQRKMLVVLPFQNLGLSEDEYFADGITEEITSRLAALKELGIISRTSALHYKNTDKTIKQIADELNVDYILEGTVRWQKHDKDESRVRITPQLIRVSDDTHLWSQAYDRLFQDIFSIQSEIAEQVIQRLELVLSESEYSVIRVKPTDNVVAHQAYLRGLDYLKYSHAPEDQYRKAQKMFEQATELDPNFALAYVKLAEAHRSMYFLGYDHTSERIEKAKKAVDTALELQPKLPAAHVELGYYYYHGYLDYDKALKEFSIAAESLPNSNELLANIAFVWRRQGLFEQAINNLEQALALSPNDASLMAELAHSYISIRKYEDAIHYCDQCMSVAPNNKWAYLIKALCYWCWQGDLASARSVFKDMPDKEAPYSILFLFLQEIYERNYQSALDKLTTLSKEAIEVQSAFIPKSLLAGWAYNLLNDSLHAQSSFQAAKIFLEKLRIERPDDPRVHSSLGITYANLGLKQEAIREGKKAVALYPVTKDALLGTNRIMDLISIYVITGNYKDAMDQITYLLSIPCHYSMEYLSLNPRMDALRKLPRFQKLIERYSGRQ